MFVAEEWFEKVVNVNRVNERLMVLKIGVGKQLNIISAYASHSPSQQKGSRERRLV